ncbi:MAG: PIN domain-containing protein [Anaerolineales bacterium]|nr:PIN domain-containing protein [Anaerolineales bacterium]
MYQSSISFRITEFIIRFIGLFIFGPLSFSFGATISRFIGVHDTGEMFLYQVVFALLGGLSGFILIPYFTTRPARAIRRKLGHLSAETLFAGLVGLIVGLLTAALLAFPLSLLPSPFGEILPFLGVAAFSYFGVSLFVMRQGDLLGLFSALSGRGGEDGSSSSSWTNLNRNILLDTSVIIDGRVADIAKTGFLPGTLLIPRFVLNELQYIADSPDGLRRQRGRRGMEVLAELQRIPSILVRISDIDAEGVREVDDKLVVLARQLKCPILTNDFNLNKIAELQGVTILNINELANAVKSVVLPAEHMNLNIFQEGKEPDQGVGYMDDGTMVVVENGHDYIGEYKDVVVTKVLQTAAGRMIFARVDEENGNKKQ